jgi:SAM-dependent methyltransferase
MSQIVVPDEAVKYILFQRTAYQQFPKTFVYRKLKRYIPFSIYDRVVEAEARIFSSRIKALYDSDIRNEYMTIKGYLPNTCSSILDIGCGVSGIDVLIYKHYMDTRQEYYLLDKTYTENIVYYGFARKGAFYNSLEVAKETLVRNGVPERNVHLVTANDKNEINIDCNVDLVISLISWGYHYPMETYLDRAFSLLKKGGLLIMDVRGNTDGVDLLKNKFGKVEVIFNGDKFHRVLSIK